MNRILIVEDEITISRLIAVSPLLSPVLISPINGLKMKHIKILIIKIPSNG